MNILEKILLGQNAKSLGLHLSNYLNLYIKPLKVWKQIISNRKTSYDLIILHLIYYLLFVVLLLDQSTTAIVYVLAEAVATLIPFLIFFPAFILFKRIFKKSIQWSRLFRLLLILKLQFIPIIIILISLANKTKIDNLYIIIENLIGLFWIALIIIFPLLLTLKIWQKILWAVGNYVSSIGFMAIIIFSTYKFQDMESLSNYLSIKTPSLEYLNFEIEKENSEMLIRHQHYFVLIEPDSTKIDYQAKPQFATSPLLIAFYSTKANQLAREVVLLDSLKSISEGRVPKQVPKDSIDTYPVSEELTIEKLNAFRESFNKQFFNDLNKTVLLKDSATFKSNREYFGLLHKYLAAYHKSYVNKDTINYILNKARDTNQRIESIDLGEDRSLSLLTVDTTYYGKLRKDYLDAKRIIEKRSEQSYFVYSIIFYPVDIILDLLEVEL